jgi:curved DNA-binding protein CbpA
MNPYLVLRVPREADDQHIRQAYLDAIRSATPDTHPERFQAASAAYEKIKDETSRLRYALFNHDCPGDSPLDVFLRQARLHARFSPLPFELMKQYLRACSKHESPT